MKVKKIPNINTHIFKQPNLPWASFTSLTRYLESIVEITNDQSDKDTWQKFVGGGLKIGEEIFIYYTGNTWNGLTGASSGDVDLIFLTRLIDGVWTKELDTGSPKVILDVGSGGQFDETEVFVGSTINDNGTIKMYYTAKASSTLFSVGLATSADGITFVKQGQIYTEDPIDIALFAITKVSDGDWRAIFSSTEVQSDKHRYATC